MSIITCFTVDERAFDISVDDETDVESVAEAIANSDFGAEVISVQGDLGCWDWSGERRFETWEALAEADED